MTIIARAVLLLCLVPAWPIGAGAQLLECRGAHRPQQVAELIFGRSIAGRSGVNEEQWVLFLDEEITPRFPDGLTVYDATGQWRDKASNNIIRELTKIVLIVLPGKTDDVTHVNEIAEAYKRRFGQQSVGIVLRPACVSF